MSEAGAASSRRLSYAWVSHRGNFRPNNEDAVRVLALAGPEPELAAEAAPPLQPDDALSGAGELDTAGAGCLAVVCDGVGGGAAGEIASSLAAATLCRSLREAFLREPGATVTDECAHTWLHAAVRAAHHAILDRIRAEPALEGMGTTLTAAWLSGDRLHLAQVGDSRLYRFRDGALEQLSLDQSLVGGLVRAGTLSEAEARRHPLRNIIDQAVGGTSGEITPQIAHFDLRPGDEFLACSDGLTDALGTGSLRHLLREHGRAAPDQAAAGLMRAALDSAGRDNISLALLRVARDRGRLPSWLSDAWRKIGLRDG